MTAELLTYPFRRFGWWLRDPSVVCRYQLCPKPQVGLSVWCREHTDRILAREKDELSGDCETDCQEACAYPGQFTECEL